MIKNPDYSIIAQYYANITIAFITLLIPFIIATYGEYIKHGKTDKYAKIDEVIYMKEILGNGVFALYLGLMIFPSVLILITKNRVLFLLCLITFLIGLYKIIKVFIKILLWSRRDRDAIRINYISNINATNKNNINKINCFYSELWNISNIGKEKDYIDYFFSLLEKYRYDNDEYKSSFGYLMTCFNDNLEHRNIELLIFNVIRKTKRIKNIYEKQIGQGNNTVKTMQMKHFFYELYKKIYERIINGIQMPLYENYFSFYFSEIINIQDGIAYSRIMSEYMKLPNVQIEKLSLPKECIVSPKYFDQKEQPMSMMKSLFIKNIQQMMEKNSLNQTDIRHINLLFAKIFVGFDLETIVLHVIFSCYQDDEEMLLKALLEKKIPCITQYRDSEEALPYKQDYNISKLNKDRISYSAKLMKEYFGETFVNNGNYKKWKAIIEKGKTIEKEENNIKRLDRIIDLLNQYIDILSAEGIG